MLQVYLQRIADFFTHICEIVDWSCDYIDVGDVCTNKIEKAQHMVETFTM